MCGIAGFIGTTGKQDLTRMVQTMTDTLVHRGPDDGGVWVDEGLGVALGHRRLSILDLSPAGHQPMLSDCGRYVLVFNGEIYNHLELRSQLPGPWRGHSDTETLLAGFSAWGLDATLGKTVGMFALALWDRESVCLSLARDRMGEKPLYYGWQGQDFLFASELKALKVHRSFCSRIDPDAVSLLLRHNYIPAPWSIWRGISKLMPGTILTISHIDKCETTRVYWSLAERAEAGQASPLMFNDDEATDQLEKVLKESIAQQMIADVPLGALLSGGIDSSAVVALMQEIATSPVKTFSIGFEEKAFDESSHAEAVARHLKTDHTTLMMSATDVLNAVPHVPELFDEPFADSSQLPTALVMSLAKKHVTVALSGDAGDELFGGYNRYFIAPKLWQFLGRVPHPMRRQFGQLLLGVPVSQWDRWAGPLLRKLGQAHPGDKAHKLGHRLVSVRSLDDLYEALVTEWAEAESMVKGSCRQQTRLSDRKNWPKLTDPVHRMMAVDALAYLPDDILVKVDRSAMATSLETRAPFLDHRVVEFAWQLPLSMKIRQGQGKWLLRQVLYRKVPKELIDRPKMGFGIPLDQWLRHELRDWAESLLSEAALSRPGLLDVPLIRAVWQQHLTGTRSFGYRLWSILMFQSWLTAQKVNVS